MEKIKVTEARELCQLNGIEIYPFHIAYSTRIAVNINGKVRLGKDLYISETVRDHNGKWMIGYKEKINNMWLFYAAKIKKKLKAHNLEVGNTGGAAAAGLPFFITPKDEFIACLILFAIVVGLTALVTVLALAYAAYKKNKDN
ncbi:hypothetical protein ACFSYG_11990 [Leeuwenhoekiella polynyae]|uniref:Uncharacterized protein n=1 Tax=Leeuwenhoekiella polynyae TaxID=1550906 RepID=A0A4Q0PFM3_9FLAO|nr:hypothetical protein [Leeuwenhoekiella polynyae]RXG25684.1 hypothetical protein DSM02_851 [Leeuwenhoekiella polynyae]